MDGYKVKLRSTVRIENGKIHNKNVKANKIFEVDKKLMSAVIKKIPFENLYTGYQSLVYRHPFDKYNRDINIFDYVWL